MKRFIILIAFFVTVSASAQTASLALNTTGTADTILFNKAIVQVSSPYYQDTVKVVKIIISQWKEITAGDVVTRTRTIIAPASVAAVLYLDPNTLKVAANKTALNIVLATYGINVTVL